MTIKHRMRVRLYSQVHGSDAWTFETECPVDECFPDDPESTAIAIRDLQAYGQHLGGGGAQPLFRLIPADGERAATWFELARDLHPGSRVKFVMPWDIFPHCVVPAGTLGTVKETGLNEIWGGLLVVPDNAEIRERLASWDGAIQLGYNEGLDPGVEDASIDPAWQADSPLAVVTE
jgi:hypothetical protein